MCRKMRLLTQMSGRVPDGLALSLMVGQAPDGLALSLMVGQAPDGPTYKKLLEKCEKIIRNGRFL